LAERLIVFVNDKIENWIKKKKKENKIPSSFLFKQILYLYEY
jgi:hypothetical protein